MSVLIPATLPRSSIRHTISITYFCADEQMADINRTKNIRLGEPIEPEVRMALSTTKS